jgi:hypothetical protein
MDLLGSTSRVKQKPQLRTDVNNTTPADTLDTNMEEPFNLLFYRPKYILNGIVQFMKNPYKRPAAQNLTHKHISAPPIAVIRVGQVGNSPQVQYL